MDGMFQIYQRLEHILPLGSQLLWDDWRERPAVNLEDLDGDGKKEMVVAYFYENKPYTTIFKHVNKLWYHSSTSYGIESIRLKDVNLFPASVKRVGGLKWGYINEDGKFVSPIKYEEAEDFQEVGLAVVQLNGKYGLIDRFGQLIVSPKYTAIYPFSEGRAVVLDVDAFKVINKWGKELTEKGYSYIDTYNNGMAKVAEMSGEGRYLYGYINKQGKVIIPIQYEDATNFHDGKAVVKGIDGKSKIINREGNIIHSFDYPFVGELREGLLPFKAEENGKYGYIDEFGEVVIEPKFTRAFSFRDGRAIAGIGEDYLYNDGLINREGIFIYESIYADILRLDEDRVALGKAIDKEHPTIGRIYAIANLDGKILTNFIYTDVQEFKDGYASVTDEKNTFFINENGKTANHLPITKGSGTLSFEGALIKGNIDMRLRYYNQKGILVWSQNQNINLNSRFRVIERKYKPNKDYLVYYPEIQGMRFATKQKKVNETLAELAGVKEIPANEQLGSSYTGDFDISFFKKQLLVIEIHGYEYPFGAAHGMPNRIYVHVDLESGVFHELKDLFKADSSYVEVLSGIIGEQIKTIPEYNYVFPDSYKGIASDQPFYVDEINLYIYFSPYEIAAYAVGFPTFKIPFDEIENILDKNGAFWRAFH